MINHTGYKGDGLLCLSQCPYLHKSNYIERRRVTSNVIFAFNIDVCPVVLGCCHQGFEQRFLDVVETEVSFELVKKCGCAGQASLINDFHVAGLCHSPHERFHLWYTVESPHLLEADCGQG